MSNQNKEIRRCIDCKEYRPREKFPLSITYNKPLSVCEDCNRIRSHKDYVKNREARMKRKAEYRKSPAGRATARRATNASMKRYPEKEIARRKVRYAVSTGKMTKEPCRDCGNTKVEGHHYKGYEPEHWYDILWLCRKHHQDIHKFSLESRGIIPPVATTKAIKDKS
jgi:hypothetical protein